MMSGPSVSAYQQRLKALQEKAQNNEAARAAWERLSSAHADLNSQIDLTKVSKSKENSPIPPDVQIERVPPKTRGRRKKVQAPESEIEAPVEQEPAPQPKPEPVSKPPAPKRKRTSRPYVISRSVKELSSALAHQNQLSETKPTAPKRELPLTESREHVNRHLREAAFGLRLQNREMRQIIDHCLTVIDTFLERSTK